MELRRLQRDEVTFTLEATEDDLPIQGNAQASGDDEDDKRVEAELLLRRAVGDVWAWASVKVTAEWHGFKGVDYLGACSYKDETEFRQDAYYEMMCDNALTDLQQSMQRIADGLEPLVVEVAANEEGVADQELLAQLGLGKDHV